MARTYYIVEHIDENLTKHWWAHKRGVFSTFNIFDAMNTVSDTVSFYSPDECEKRLRNILTRDKPKVIRVLKI